MRKSKFALVLTSIILALIVVMFMPMKLIYAQSLFLYPQSGPVGTQMSLSGSVMYSNDRYQIWFDIDADGNAIENGEHIKNGTAIGTSFNDSFTVPLCVGNRTGYPHMVRMTDKDGYFAYFGYAFFSVVTSMNMTVTPSARVGDRVPINITISGGQASTNYSFNVTLADSSGNRQISPLFQQTSDNRGSLSTVLYYPDSFPSATSKPGNCTVFAEVKDVPATGSGFTTMLSPRSFTIQPGPNQQPIAHIISISPNPAILGQQVTFTGNGTDIDGNITAYQWTSDINGTLSTSRTFSTSSLMLGTHRISFTVRDNNLNWSASDTQTLIVESPPVKAPIAYIDSITPNPAAAGKEVTFVGHGNESERLITGYRWTSSIDGWLSGTNTFSISSLSVGSHTISFEVQDSSNVWSEPVTASLTIGAANVPPRASIDSILPDSIVAGQPVVFSGHGDDVDGAIEGYRWTSSIDGLLSTSSEFSTSELSVGVHTISFQVQDSSGAWSNEETIILEIKEATSLFWLLPVAGTFAVASGALSLIHFTRPPSSGEVKNNLQREQEQEAKREEKEKKKRKREIEKGKPFLDLKLDSPSRIMGATSYEAKLRIKNVGLREAKDVTVTVDSTPGLQLDTQPPIIPSLNPGEEYVLVYPFKASEQIRKGVYALRFEVKGRDTWKQVRNCYARAIKVGLLSNAGKKDYAEHLREWLKAESYTCDELANADHLVRGLLKYDLIILAPELELAQQWMRNLAAFVENSQSLLAIEKMITNEEKTLAELLGYSEMQYEEFKSEEGLLKICDKQHFITRDLAPEEEIAMGQSWGNVCISKPTTGRSLVEQFIGTESKYNEVISALTINQFMEGKTAHLNFHADQSPSDLSPMLEKIFDWLLSEETLVQPKQWSPGLRSLKLVFRTLREFFHHTSNKR